MICFIATAAYFKPLAALVKGIETPLPACCIMSYDQLFSATRLHAGTYVFTDLERLSNQELLLASAHFRTMRATAGFTVLNDPARVETRYALLRSLFDAGINRFDVYRADGRPRPARFPVFVRAESTHDSADTSLLMDQSMLDAALTAFPEAGEPLRGLLVIEYAAQPLDGSLFRRWAAFCIGGRIHLDHVVTEKSWNVKYGEPGLVPEAVYADDAAAIRENRFHDVLTRAFAIAGIDYGRADFGIVDGQAQIYEINTNPTISTRFDHFSPSRREAYDHARARFAENLRAIDSPRGQRRRDIDVDCQARRFSRSRMEQDRRRRHVAQLPFRRLLTSVPGTGMARSSFLAVATAFRRIGVKAKGGIRRKRLQSLAE